jgi:hypothetical protein
MKHIHEMRATLAVGQRYFMHCSSILHGAGLVAWWYAFLSSSVTYDVEVLG